MKSQIIEVRVFSKPEDDEEKVYEGLLKFFPFETEKIIQKRNAIGFNNRKIVVFSATLDKQRLIKLFLKKLSGMLSSKQKNLLVNEASERIDEKLCIYLRFGKNKLIQEDKLCLAGGGDCYHIKIGLAAFPRKKERAIRIVSEIFS